MRISILFVLCLSNFVFFAQGRKPKALDLSSVPSNNVEVSGVNPPKKTATIDMYRFISLDQDTTYIDTSLTIQKEYSHNYLRRDTFGLLPFANDGQTYTTLQYGLMESTPYPEFGFKAKHFNFIEANQIRYASVATPVTELYFKSTQTRGQSVDSYLTLNTAPNLNFSIAYRGLRSQGKYINQLASTGNFRFTTSYHTKNKRYFANLHYTQQDILNEENGGITTLSNFESENAEFNNRQRLEVFLTDARSFLKGKRFFLDHSYQLTSGIKPTHIYLKHQFNYENKFFEYNQATVPSSSNGSIVYRFGESFKLNEINDQTRYNKMYNQLGLTFENKRFGKFTVFADDFRSNFYYNQILIFDQGTVPNALSYKINNFGSQYQFRYNKWNGNFLYFTSITNHYLSNLEARIQYDWDDSNQLILKFQNNTKLPNNNYNLYQSSYIAYNWSNNFKNEKINSLSANAITSWLNVSLYAAIINDYLFFNDVSTPAQKVLQTQIVSPSQYSGEINYFSLKLAREFKMGKFGIDNTLLYQKVAQEESVLNVPEIVVRNAVYFSDYYFKKALFMQTGVVINYFSSYFANEYNPVIGEFFVQRDKQIGNFPTLDFFVNAKIQRTRIYIKAEHFNSSFTGNNFYVSPTNPYRDFTVRFGLIWNFFE